MLYLVDRLKRKIRLWIQPLFPERRKLDITPEGFETVFYGFHINEESGTSSDAAIPLALTGMLKGRQPVSHFDERSPIAMLYLVSILQGTEVILITLHYQYSLRHLNTGCQIHGANRNNYGLLPFCVQYPVSGSVSISVQTVQVIVMINNNLVLPLDLLKVLFWKQQ